MDLSRYKKDFFHYVAVYATILIAWVLFMAFWTSQASVNNQWMILPFTIVSVFPMFIIADKIAHKVIGVM
jgi:hypothetical protein